MSAKLLRIFVIVLVFCAIISTVSAGRLKDVAGQKGFSPKLVKKKNVGDSKPKAQPIVKRAPAATSTSVCTTAPAPNPTSP